MGRWDRFRDPRSITGVEMLADEAVKVLYDDLRGWPPPVDTWLDPDLRARFADALDPECPRPAQRAFRLAFQLADWELEREYEAIDEVYRNDRLGEVTTSPRERLALVFLHRWLTDVSLELIEVSPLTRADLQQVLRRVERLLLLD